MFIAAEPRQAGRHLNPGLARHIVRLGLGRNHPEVAQQPGLRVAEDAGEGGLVTGLCLGQDHPERGADHRTSIRPAPAGPPPATRNRPREPASGQRAAGRRDVDS